MSYRYIFHPDAQQDYEEALIWYAEKSLLAAENFVTSVDQTLVLICEYPRRWRNEYKRFRELGVKKYPYTIIYTIEEPRQLIVVTSIYHHKRNSGKKYRNP